MSHLLRNLIDLQGSFKFLSPALRKAQRGGEKRFPDGHERKFLFLGNRTLTYRIWVVKWQQVYDHFWTCTRRIEKGDEGFAVAGAGMKPRFLLETV